MKQLAPDVWAHDIDAEGFPTVSAVILTPRLRHRRRHAHGPAGHGPRASTSWPRRPAGAASWSSTRTTTGTTSTATPPSRAWTSSPSAPARGSSTAELQSGDESLRLPPPEGVPLPTITFGDRLTYTDDDETRAPHPHARPQRGLARRLPRRVPPPVRRRHGGVAAAQLRPARRHGGVGPHAAPAQAAAGRPHRARPRAGHGQEDHRRQRALHRRRLRGGRRGQGRRASAATSSTCRRPASSRTASLVDDVYEAAHRDNLLWAWDEVWRAAAASPGGPVPSACTNWTLSSNSCTKSA